MPIRAAIAALACLLGLSCATRVSAVETGARPTQEVRAERYFREEHPLWQRALALPADVLAATAWPLRQTLFWMERIDLPERIEDAVMAPYRFARGDGASR
jgi:hypothetical protein